MTIETKYNLGDVFYKPSGKDVLELRVNRIVVSYTNQGQRTQYQLGTGSSVNYSTLWQDELGNKLQKGEIYLTKKELLSHYIDILTE